MRKVVVAMDSFKGSLTSWEAALAVEAAIHEVYPDCQVVKAAIADGGEGTADALVRGMGGRFVRASVHDPLMRPLEVGYGLVDDGRTAVMDLSAAAGLTLLKTHERNPELTTTYGVGEMMADALGRGCRRILLGIGGSATNDGAMGLLCALGYRFLDDKGRVLHGNGSSLARVSRMDSSMLLPMQGVEVRVACDVCNPFFGARGAACVFAPQKGADAAMVQRLDAGLAHFAEVVRRFNGVDITMLPGAGAAGGVGGGLAALLDAKLCSGIDMVLEALSFDRMLAHTDLVITGEGRLDAQTAMGKAPGGVLAMARKQGIPVVGISGAVEAADDLLRQGFSAVFPIQAGPVGLSDAMGKELTAANVSRTIKQLMSLLKSLDLPRR